MYITESKRTNIHIYIYINTFCIHICITDCTYPIKTCLSKGVFSKIPTADHNGTSGLPPRHRRKPGTCRAGIPQSIAHQKRFEEGFCCTTPTRWRWWYFSEFFFARWYNHHWSKLSNDQNSYGIPSNRGEQSKHICEISPPIVMFFSKTSI